jgi:hypothetical protein
MITSDRQYDTAKNKLDDLKQALKQPAKESLPKQLIEGARKQTKSLIAEIQKEIQEYEELVSGQKEIKISSIDDLRLAPIRYRIAKGFTMSAFSKITGLQERQVHRYEKEEYRQLSVERLSDILKSLKIKFDGEITLKDSQDDPHKDHIA